MAAPLSQAPSANAEKTRPPALAEALSTLPSAELGMAFDCYHVGGVSRAEAEEMLGLDLAMAYLGETQEAWFLSQPQSRGATEADAAGEAADRDGRPWSSRADRLGRLTLAEFASELDLLLA
ncbi:MAG: hypothetical protein V1750_06735, partial [Acidobacteriota bacterium]